MKLTILMLLVAGLFLPAASAKTINSPTCNWDDFCNCYYGYVDSNGVGHAGAQRGDTIVLPAGTAKWGIANSPHTNMLYIIIPVNIVGQDDNTVITLDDSGPVYSNGVIQLRGDGLGSTFSHFKIVGSNTSPVTAISMVVDGNYGPALGGFRIHHMTYDGGTGGANFINIGDWVQNGVIDHCNLNAQSGQAELIFGHGWGNAWTQADTLGQENNIFIEDNVFGSPGGYVCDCNANGQFVVRYNTMNGLYAKADGHGFYSNTPPHSFRNMEIYGNTWTANTTNGTAIEIRGGTAMIFNNTANPAAAGCYFFLTEYSLQAPSPNFGVSITGATIGNPTTITTAQPHGYQTGWTARVRLYAPNANPPVNITADYVVTVKNATQFTIPVAVADSTSLQQSYVTRMMTPYDYPIYEQVGVGLGHAAASAPAYVWNNKLNGGIWPRNLHAPAPGAISLYQTQTKNPSATFTEADVIRSNRDFYADAGFDTNTGVSVGTTAQMNALKPSIIGYGFWVTDQGSWNTKLPPGTSGMLYTWSGNGWVPKYTPYRYPHPSTLPQTPTGLRVIGN